MERKQKKWKGFVHKHRDSFSKNKFSAFGNSAEGQNMSVKEISCVLITSLEHLKG